MHYTKKEIITRIVADEIIDDISIIKELLNALKSSKADCSISYYKNLDHIASTHPRVRIMSCSETDFSIQVLTTSGTMLINKIPYSGIISLSTFANPSETLLKKNSLGKADVLDI